MNMPMADSGDPVPPEQLPAPQHIDGAGNVRFPITANAQAQKWFEQGYNLLYDFWDYEADRAFEESIRADANCAMCYWGLYQAESFNHSETKTYAQAPWRKLSRWRGMLRLAKSSTFKPPRRTKPPFARPAPGTQSSIRKLKFCAPW
jgi:hypothetical protein